MLLTFLACAAVGVALAGVVLAASHALRLRAPRWIYPATIGLGMIGTNIYLEYTWFSQMRGRLGDRVVVLGTGTYAGTLQPWTLAVPRVNRFSALDRGSLQEGPEGMMRGEVLLVARMNPLLRTEVMVDCAGQRRGLPGEDGAPLWTPLETGDPLLAAACPGGV